MSSDSPTTTSPQPVQSAPTAVSHPGLALAVIASAQLILVLDNTIMNIALPSIQTDLDISSANLAWVVNAYALAFGGLMLLGGRAGDLYGRRRVFRFGLAVFTLASLLGGLAPNEATLLGARVVQGVGAAIASPTALSLIATTFPEGKPRNRALGVYAAMAGVGSALGLMLGGVLTDYLNWRWVLFVNVPIGLLVVIGTRFLGDANRDNGRLDVPGAITATAGMVSLVYAITRGGEDGWTDAITVSFFVVAAVLLSVFLFTQARVAEPMMPLRLLRDRNRAGSYATMLLVGAGMFSTFYFLTLYMQQTLSYSPVKTGFAYLPFTFGMGISAGFLGAKLVAFVPPRAVVAPGALIGAGGLLWFSSLDASSSYTTHLMPAMFVTALGLGLCLVPLTLGAVRGVGEHDAGIASGLLDASQQVGGALGLAALSTVSTTVADNKLPHAGAAYFRGIASHDFGLVERAKVALTDGYTSSFGVGSAVLAGAALLVVVAVNAKKPQPGDVHPPVG
ncbi:MFS transporter [Streptomyces orinoci]|uniref:MFS transporter n=1 Tax=Streptomyces orinoci TaxID=67339 RepID=A0ABV3K263_STRON|nr:MFS transporter [Streptomyces orinoci]